MSFNKFHLAFVRASNRTRQRIASIVCFSDCIRQSNCNASEFRVQSDDEVEFSASGSNVIAAQNVEFVDSVPSDTFVGATSKNSVAHVDGTEDIPLGTFLARPTIIDTTTWSTSDLTGIKTTLQPWYLFLNNSVIKNKIQNYAFLRGTLKIKIVLNATPFQYGALRACYMPLIGWMANKIRTGTPPGNEFIPYSQTPGVFLYPQTNTGGEMTLPFVLHKNWMDITSASQVQNMGTLYYYIYSALQLANATSTSVVSVQTYAWMENVELMGPTAKASLQGDEYVEGPISGPATAVASVANTLSKIPIIGKFARATEIGATALASVARLFGYTNVPVIEAVHAFQPQNAPMLASAHIGVPVQKLTLDPKQELSIDPTLHGVTSVDELSINYLKKKESIIAVPQWNTADIPGTVIWSMRVQPNQSAFTTIVNAGLSTVGLRVQHTPLSYIGAMFKHWRGSMKVRIRFICSKFHKGRVIIHYDPRGDITGADTPSANNTYSHIVDLREDSDVVLTIPYHQDKAWSKYNQAITSYNGAGPFVPNFPFDNGILSMRVLNELNAPISGKIDIIVSAWGGEDLEFANPNEKIGPDDTNQYPSFFPLQGDESIDLVFGDPAQPDENRYALNYGECVASLRNILHRSVVADVVNVTKAVDGTYAYRTKMYKIMPYAPGFLGNASFPISANNIVAASGSSPFAYNTMSHMAYISAMFVGYRGGATYTVTPGNDLYGDLCDFRVSRMTRRKGLYPAARWIENGTGVNLTSSISTLAAFLNTKEVPNDGLSGMAITSTNTNGSLQFYIPDFKIYNFSFADPNNYLLGSANDDTDNQGAALRFIVKTSSQTTATATSAQAVNTSGEITLQSEVAAGPDFTCLFWLCCPTLDYANSVPTPV